MSDWGYDLFRDNPADELDRLDDPYEDDGYGPLIEAGFDSRCDGTHVMCDGFIREGETIRADGDGGWVHQGCEG